MDDAYYRTVAVCRRFHSETVAVKVQKGVLWRFSPESFSFLNFFATGGSLGDYFDAAEITDESERSYLREFLRELSARELVAPVDSKTSLHCGSVRHARPAFLEDSEKRVGEVALLCRLTQPSTSQTGT